jgi:putative MFS transporter
MEASAVHTPPSVPIGPSNPESKRATRWSELLSHSYRSRTLIVWMLWFCAYFIANSLNNWLPSLYNTVYHLGLGPALRAASMTNVAQVIVLLICAFSIDRIGRRNWIAASFIIGAALLGMLGFLASTSVTSVMILATLSYGLIGSSNAVLYLYTPEIYPTRMRAIGTGVATSWLRLASAVGPALVGYMVGAMGIGAVFLMFAAVGIMGAFAAARMIETRGQRLEEIAA